MVEQGIKVSLLLEHHEGDENWTAKVPLIEGCLAEGPTPEDAAKAIISEIEYFTGHQPNLLEVLKRQPKFMLTEVDFPINNQVNKPGNPND